MTDISKLGKVDANANLQGMSDELLKSCADLFAGEHERRRIANSTTSYSVEYSDFVCMLFQMTKDASVDELADAFNAIQGRCVAKWIEGDDMYTFFTTETISDD